MKTSIYAFDRRDFIFTVMTAVSRKIFYACLPVYFVLLALSVVYYKEKAFFLDNAYVIFNMVKDGHMTIYHFRFIEIFTEGLPWLAMKLHASLDVILLSYALSFWVFQLACYLLCGLWLRQYALALIQVLVSVLFISDGFYTSISELPQAISLLCLLYAYVLSGRGRGRPAFYVICGALLVTIAFAHLLIVFPLGFVTLFFYFRKDRPIPRNILWGIPAAYMLIVVLKAIFFQEKYEHHALGGLKHFITLFPDYFSAYSFERFFAYLGGRYIWIILLSAGITVYYLVQREWRTVGLFMVAMTGYAMLTNVTYPGADTNDFYIENLYYPLAVFIAFPFVYDLVPVLAQRKQALPVVLLVMLSGLARMWYLHTPYTARLVWQREFIRANAGKKLMIDKTAVPMDTLQMNWASSYEFALLSSAERRQTESIIIADTVEHIQWAAGERKKLVTQWGNIGYSEMPVRFFRFTDTVSSYTVVR